MRLEIIMPDKVLDSVLADRIKLPTIDGSFGVMPRHRDGVWILDIGILEVFYGGEWREFYAVNRGIAVKEGGNIYISTLNSVRGESLEKLQKELDIFYENRENREKKTREILTKLEIDIVKKFMTIER